MSLRRRLEKLEEGAAAASPAPTLTDAERARRIQSLLEYQGHDPDILRRRGRVIELLDRWRAKTDRAG